MKILFIILGSVSLVLGIIGIVVPLLPTTPFLLLSATLYLHSSPRLYAWLLSTKYLGAYIRDYKEHRSVPLKSKIIALAMLWASLGYCIRWVVEGVLWAQLLLFAIGVGVTWHILSLKTKR
ncbi:MAG: YbaN family protein [Rikenellaceae bacterium]